MLWLVLGPACGCGQCIEFGRGGQADSLGKLVDNGGAHPNTGRPFVCMRGVREYHIHSSHTSDLWDNYRGTSGMDLAGIVLQLWKAWKKSVG